MGRMRVTKYMRLSRSGCVIWRAAPALSPLLCILAVATYCQLTQPLLSPHGIVLPFKNVTDHSKQVNILLGQDCWNAS